MRFYRNWNQENEKIDGNVFLKWVIEYGWYMKTLVVLHKLECEEKNLIHKMKNQTFLWKALNTTTK